VGKETELEEGLPGSAIASEASTNKRSKQAIYVSKEACLLSCCIFFLIPSSSDNSTFVLM